MRGGAYAVNQTGSEGRKEERKEERAVYQRHSAHHYSRACIEHDRVMITAKVVQSRALTHVRSAM